MIQNRLTNQIIADEVRIASSFFKQLVGWIGHLPREGEAMIFPGCSAIHTWFMKTGIDLLFINKSGCVIKAVNVLPWRFSVCSGAEKAIELPEGTIKKYGISVGDCLDTSF